MRTDIAMGEPSARAWTSAFRQTAYSFVALIVILAVMCADIDVPGWVIVGFAGGYLVGLWRLGRRVQEFLR